MYGLPRHLIAQAHVPRVGWDAPYQIAGIQVLEADGNVAPGEMLLDAIAQKETDIFVDRVAGSVGARCSVGKQVNCR